MASILPNEMADLIHT